MNEPKPEDVMRALEQMASKANCNYMRHLEGCGYFCIRLGKNVDDMAKGRGPECNENCEHFSPPYIEEVLRSALALLREKDAEIEMLKKDREELIVTLKMNDAPFPEGLQIVHDFCEKRKMEAISEFAERLKSEVNGGQFASYKGLEIRNVIDQIAKEMKEGSDGSDGVH